MLCESLTKAALRTAQYVAPVGRLWKAVGHAVWFEVDIECEGTLCGSPKTERVWCGVAGLAGAAQRGLWRQLPC